jgi:hypothetical protein
LARNCGNKEDLADFPHTYIKQLQGQKNEIIYE